MIKIKNGGTVGYQKLKLCLHTLRAQR